MRVREQFVHTRLLRRNRRVPPNECGILSSVMLRLCRDGEESLDEKKMKKFERNSAAKCFKDHVAVNCWVLSFPLLDEWLILCAWHWLQNLFVFTKLQCNWWPDSKECFYFSYTQDFEDLWDACWRIALCRFVGRPSFWKLHCQKDGIFLFFAFNISADLRCISVESSLK